MNGTKDIHMIPEHNTPAYMPTGIFVNKTEDPTEFSSWIMEHVQEYINGRILQIEAGKGDLAEMFISKSIPLYLADALKTNRDVLRFKLGKSDYIKDVYAIDLKHYDFAGYYKDVFGAFGTVIMLNQNIGGYYDREAIVNASLFLPSEGILILTMPVNTTLYYELEDNTNDLKAYNYSFLKKYLPDGLLVKKLRYYNLKSIDQSYPYQSFGLSALVVAGKV
jgi:hypothetical protein